MGNVIKKKTETYDENMSLSLTSFYSHHKQNKGLSAALGEFFVGLFFVLLFYWEFVQSDDLEAILLARC